MPRTRSPSSGRGDAEPKKVYGITEPRLYAPSLRHLNRHTTYGYDVIDFAKLIGMPLLPWQEWLVKHALEIKKDGTYRYRIILVLIARQQGKSHLVRTTTLWRMLYDEDCRLTMGTAQDLAQASNQWQQALKTIQGIPSLASRLAWHRHVNGQEAFGLANGAEYMVRSANPDAGRGFSVDNLILDEIRTHRDRKAWSALYYTTMARPNPLTICVSNAGDESSVVLNQLREAALSGKDETIGLFEWSGEDGCELNDLRAWRQANPSLGYMVPIEAIRTAYNAEKPNVFRTEVLCQYVPQLEGAIDLGQWDACADDSGTLRPHRERVTACFDAAPDGMHATLAVAAPLGDGRARVGIARAWESTDEARGELAAVLDEIKPVAVAWYPGGPAAALASILRARPGAVELAGNKVAETCQEFADLVKGLRIIHPADPLLDMHVRGANKLNSGDGWRFGRRGEAPIDAAYAVAGATRLALTLPPVKRARVRMIA